MPDGEVDVIAGSFKGMDKSGNRPEKIVARTRMFNRISVSRIKSWPLTSIFEFEIKDERECSVPSDLVKYNIAHV